MTRKFFSPLAILLLFVYSGASSQAVNQKGKGNKKRNINIKWKAKAFDHQVFIPNEGQFNGAIPGADKVLYGAQLGDVWAYFTAKGIVYSYSEFPKKTGKETEEQKEKEMRAKPVFHYLKSVWDGSSPDVTLQAEGKLSYYYTYSKGNDGAIKADIFRSITYSNIYPGIDIKYTFPKGKEGLKYTLIVHPGADISKVKLQYPSIGKLKTTEAGDVTIKSGVGEITDHAPNAFYKGGSGSVTVSYTVSGNSESFNFSGGYDNTKTLIIDPWITDPLFGPNYDRAYDLDFDNRGNVYAYGSWMPLQLEKFNSSGSPQWVYNAIDFSTNSYYGDVVVNRKSGTAYITEGFNFSGARAIKINTNGFWLATFPGTVNLNEFWRAVYNPCYDNIVIGAGGTRDSCQACMLDTNMVVVTPINILGTTSNYHDIAFITMDPSGGFAYMGTAHTADNLFSNQICKMPVPSLRPTIYIAPDNYTIQEVASVSYVANSVGTANGMNGMAASPNWLYMFDGATLKQFDKGTGVMNTSAAITTTSFAWGGLDVDPCDDIFLGCRDTLKVYNSSLALDTAIPLPSTIYDVVLGQNNQLYACGNSFVCALNVPPLASLISTVAGSPSSCSACNGTATVNINCGVAPFSFHWSNGSTDQTDTGLCAGLYTVTVSDGSCPPRFDSTIISVGGKPGYYASVKDTNPGCILTRGNITVYPTGGTAPYTFTWSNGSTNQEDTGLVAGTYTCVITDNSGCNYFVVSTLVNPPPPNITISPLYDSVCYGTKVNLYASGLNSYTWTPNVGLSCYNCPNPTTTPTTTITYTVSAIDTNGCTATGTTTIKVLPTPKPIITGKDSICVGYRDTLYVTGGSSYTWSTGATTSSIVGVISSTRTFTVTASNGVCTHDTTFTVSVILSPTAAITAVPDTVCPGDSVRLTASGGATYLWNNGKTTTSIWVNPLVTTTYTLHAFAGTCADSATINVYTGSVITASISANDTVCPNTPVILTTTGSGGTITYKWNTGATTTSINVSDTVTTTYTATVYGKCDSVKKTVTVVIVPLPKAVIKGTLVKCAGTKDTLTVSGGTTYLWSNGTTTTSYITGQIKGDSIITVIAYNSLGCADTTRFKITEKIKPVITPIKPKVSCNGSPVTLNAYASGSGPFTYKWSDGETTSSITVSDTGTVTYTVTVSNGCPNSTTAIISPDVPPLSACCDKIIILGDDTVITAGGKGIIHYSWSPSSTLNCDTCPTVIATPTITTTYTVTGTDSLGCQTDRIVTIIVETPCFDFKVPNVFTPNYAGALGSNGGTNNIFYIETRNITGWSTIIYDRWGKEMFKTTDPNKYWDGSTESGGKAPDGVYYYIISGTCQNNTYKKDGFLQLIR